jgi:hypothetical protein
VIIVFGSKVIIALSSRRQTRRGDLKSRSTSSRRTRFDLKNWVRRFRSHHALYAIQSAQAHPLPLGPAGLDLYIAPDGPARLLQALQKYPVARLHYRIVSSKIMEHPHAPHPLALLRPRRERPRGRRAAEQRYERASSCEVFPSISGWSRPGPARWYASIKHQTEPRDW